MNIFYILLAIVHLAFAAPATEDGCPSPAAQKCESLSLPSRAGFEFEILSAQGVVVSNFSLPSSPAASGVSFCNLTVIITHPGAGDVVFVGIWLPLESWNGRFLATGGGGLAAGTFTGALAAPAAAGYAAGSTDAGLTLNHTIDANSGRWALTAAGTLNTELLKNFAHRSIHDMTVIGKAAVKEFYGASAGHSYYSGCSTGGRQGYFAAQRYPEDFDGILANAPAINTPQVSPGDFWPSVVMANIAAPPQCVFQAYLQATIAACDPLDGATDGLISAPELCHFNASSLVGRQIDCTQTGGVVTITPAHATVVAKILEGARAANGNFQWYGNPPGAPFTGLANTRTTNGTTVPVPFSAAEAWMRYFVKQDPTLDTAHLTFSAFEAIFDQSVALFTDILGTDNPDLSAFKAHGGKLLTWHGMADPLIAHPGTTLYWDRLQKKMGGPKKVGEFYRVFLAPGASHCGGGYGPVPVDPLSALVSWVEDKVVPKTLFASATLNGVKISRNLCPYPRALRYKGSGDLNSNESFACVGCVS